MAELPAESFHLSELVHWLDAGWWVEEPVLHRCGADGGYDCPTVLDVVLRKDDERRVLALGNDLAVWDFLEQRKLAILDV